MASELSASQSETAPPTFIWGTLNRLRANLFRGVDVWASASASSVQPIRAPGSGALAWSTWAQSAGVFRARDSSARAFRAAQCAVFCGLVAAGARSAAAQSRPPEVATATPVATSALPGNTAATPFGAGEHLEYEVRFSALKVGTGTMDVRDIVMVRDQPSWHTVLSIKGHIPLFSVNMLFESWFDVVNLSSRRYHEDQSYPGYKKNQTTEIFSERGMFKEGDKDEQVTVEKPLDIGSFIYFMRTIPLEVGKTYTFSQYYKPDGNPVTVKVARREQVKTPAGTFDALVLQPTIKTKGIFSEDGKAEVWLTDDASRMMVQLKSDLSIGSINLFLSKYKLGVPPKPQSP